MNAGHWDQAVKGLNPVARKSPFADIKIFAKLMAAFTLQNKPGIQKALTLLDKGFFLTSLQKLLGAYAAEDGLPQASGNGETATLLWGQSFLNQGYASDLKQAVAENNPVKITRAVAGLTARLDSPDQASAVEFLAEIAGQGVVDVTKEPDHAMVLFKKLPLPDPHAMFARFAAPRTAFLTESALPFWRQIEQLFPDPEDQKLARGLILAKIAERMVNDPDLVFELQDELDRFFSAIGCGDRVCFDDVGDGADSHLAVVAVLEQALGFDPENPMGYELLLTVPFDSPALRRALPPLLESAAGVLPHDPRPYLRLAQIYLHKSAVRKAEGVLKKAFARAPTITRFLNNMPFAMLPRPAKTLKTANTTWDCRTLKPRKKWECGPLGFILSKNGCFVLLPRPLNFQKNCLTG
jgi:tetratricopeptide (TPR) repeat protein